MTVKALAALALGCVLLGIFPVTVITAIDHVNTQLLATTVVRGGESNWLLLAFAVKGVALAANMRSAKDTKRAVCFNIIESLLKSFQN